MGLEKKKKEAQHEEVVCCTVAFLLPRWPDGRVAELRHHAVNRGKDSITRGRLSFEENASWCISVVPSQDSLKPVRMFKVLMLGRFEFLGGGRGIEHTVTCSYDAFVGFLWCDPHCNLSTILLLVPCFSSQPSWVLL